MSLLPRGVNDVVKSSKGGRRTCCFSQCMSALHRAPTHAPPSGMKMTCLRHVALPYLMPLAFHSTAPFTLRFKPPAQFPLAGLSDTETVCYVECCSREVDRNVSLQTLKRKHEPLHPKLDCPNCRNECVEMSAFPRLLACALYSGVLCEEVPARILG